MLKNLFNYAFNTKDKIATLYAIAEKIFELLINFLINFVVIRMLSIESYAVITVVAGYATIIGFLNIAPENQLFQIFHSLSKKQLKEKMKNYAVFDFIKAVIIAIIYVLLGAHLANITGNAQYIYYTVLLGIFQIEDMLWQLLRLYLELTYRQKKIVIITVISRILKLALLLALFRFHSLLAYILVNLATALLELSLGMAIFYNQKLIGRSDLHMHFSLKRIKESFSQFAFFNHISGTLNSIIYSCDTVFLQLFVSQSLVGRYGIVLAALNYINLIFQILQKQTAIALSNSGSHENDKVIVTKFMRVSVCGSIAVVLAYLIAGRLALKFYAGNSYIDDMYDWGLFILAGTSFFNAIRPMFISIIYKGDLKKYIMSVLIPIFLLMLTAYYLSSRFFGVMGMAASNTLVYGVWGISVIFTYRKITLQKTAV